MFDRMFGPISALVFDFDGTLVDTMGNVKIGIQRGIEHASGIQVEDEALYKTFGAAPQDVFRRWVAPDQVAAAMDFWLAFEAGLTSADIRPFPEVEEMLAYFHNQKFPMAIFTGRDRASTLRIMVAHGWLGKYFTEEKMVCGDDGIPTKPAPDALLKLSKVLGIELPRILMIGDHTHDVRAGQAAGSKTAAALWDLPPGQGTDRSRFREGWVRWDGVDVDVRLTSPMNLVNWLSHDEQAKKSET